ncbi:50S ribosomal protein L1 [Candidatus Woesearchaeota archaeon]|nr:50S ribosomal protein L1 [Candidatus Woesearchaeota archaeon]
MDKEVVKKAIASLKSFPKRKFQQSYDLVINLKDVDLKVPEEQVDAWVSLPHGTGKEKKICALVGGELSEQAKKVCNKVILNDEFKTYAGDKKKIKKLAEEFDFFVAQVNMMQEIAKIFGRFFGPRGKMPNPKAGCVVPPNANLSQLVERLKKTIHAVAKTQASVKCVVGNEGMPDENIADNVVAVYGAVTHSLPSEDKNIKSVLLKLTMSSPVVVGGEGKK